MDKETCAFFHNAFSNRLREIKSEMEAHGGTFKNGGMIDDTLDCIRGIKNLQKISAVSDTKTAASTGTMMLGK